MKQKIENIVTNVILKSITVRPLEENSFIHKKVYVRAAQSNRKACKLLDRTMMRLQKF